MASQPSQKAKPKVKSSVTTTEDAATRKAAFELPANFPPASMDFHQATPRGFQYAPILDNSVKPHQTKSPVALQKAERVEQPPAVVARQHFEEYGKFTNKDVTAKMTELYHNDTARLDKDLYVPTEEMVRRGAPEDVKKEGSKSSDDEFSRQESKGQLAGEEEEQEGGAEGTSTAADTRIKSRGSFVQDFGMELQPRPEGNEEEYDYTKIAYAVADENEITGGMEFAITGTGSQSLASELSDGGEKTQEEKDQEKKDAEGEDRGVLSRAADSVTAAAESVAGYITAHMPGGATVDTDTTEKPLSFDDTVETPSEDQHKGIVNSAMDSVAAAAGSVAGFISAHMPSTASTDTDTDTTGKTVVIEETAEISADDQPKGIMDSAMASITNFFSGTAATTEEEDRAEDEEKDENEQEENEEEEEDKDQDADATADSTLTEALELEQEPQSAETVTETETVKVTSSKKKNRKQKK